MKAKLSVIVPVYNMEYYLGKTIESILNQTYDDFELLLVDDGSKDGTGRVCEEYAARDRRIKVICQENAGVTSARRRGVEASCGEWICFVDADDLLPTCALQNLYDSSLDVDIVVGRMCLVLETGDVLRKDVGGITGDLDHLSYLKALLENRTSLSAWGKLFRKRLFTSSVLNIPRSIPKGEDFIMCVWLATRASNCRIIEKPVYNYVQHAESCIHRFHNTWEYEKIFDRFLLAPIIASHLEEECRESIIRAHINALKGVLDDPALNNRDLFFRQIKKEAKEISLTFREKLLLSFAACSPMLRRKIYKIVKYVYVFFL